MCCVGTARKRSQMILGRTMNNSTSQSSHMAMRAGHTRCARRISATKSHTMSSSFSCCTYRIPTSQLSSQSTKRATSPTLLQRCGSTRSRQRSTSRKYSRMTSKDSTTSVERMRAAPSTMELSVPPSAASQRCSVATASKSTLTARSSRPLRRKFATELRCEMHFTRRSCASRYSGSWLRPAPRPYRASRSRSERSCSIACTTSFRAFSSMPMSSEMYLCSKSAHVASTAVMALRSSERAGRVESRGCSAAWLQRPRRALSSDQACCSASARRMASALNSNLSPLTQMTAYCSILASSTSTR
mmetsp:Transcript_41239/g.131048  ORF Transcript_41239/g.131048 Transcript_41239/m.131048 type:complete len:302 (+) Transcript_41239:784-1689(+)